jgi:hypothetical protein
MMRLLSRNNQKLVLMLLSIISSLLSFSNLAMANDDVERTNKTSNVDENPPIKTFIINGTNPYKHILSDIEADLASQSYSRINSLIR